MPTNISDLLRQFLALGVVSAFCKPLAENDNSKQQVYLGGSFDVVQMFPFDDVIACTEVSEPNYKARLDFYWLYGEGLIERAEGAQLILYPQYPEVRLSGFLRGCRYAPNELLRPVPAEQRQHNNQPDGRVLFFGITSDRKILAWLAPADSTLAQEFWSKVRQGEFEESSVFYVIPLPTVDSKILLISKLSEIRANGWHGSVRLNRHGDVIPYKARNGGGYTLEALLGIIPNGRSEPDYLGWEVKGYGGDRLTLMTPEPDDGLYGQEGVETFVRLFGHQTDGDTLYFTGMHRVNVRNSATGLTMTLRGYNPQKAVIDDVNGAVELLTDNGECAAAWSFSALLAKWNHKHAKAVYVGYKSRDYEGFPQYRYLSPAHFGEGTDFVRYLSAMHDGAVVFDPGSKVMNASSGQSTVKARSQFRMPFKLLARLYKTYGPTEI